MNSDQDPDLALAFVLLKHSEKPSGTKIVQAAAALGVRLHVTDASEAGVSFATDAGATMQVMTMGFPHPDAQKEAAIGPTSIKLAEARASADHVMIVARGLAGTPRERDGRLAAVTAAVIDTMPAIGAMLGHGLIFHKARLFRDAAAEAPTIPPLLMADVTMAREADSRLSFLTHGMTRHGREDLYVTCPIKDGNDAANFIFGLVRWMLTDPTKKFPTGETVGRTATERVRVQRVPNPNGRGEVVMRLDLS